jgi:cytoskeletal protein RodZ
MSTPAVGLSRGRVGGSCLSLASVRQRKGMTLEDIAQSTMISSYYLQAIEEEDFDKLPGGVYNTSYIRQYARAIGYSERELLDQYNTRTEQATTEEAKPKKELPVLEMHRGTRGATRLVLAMEFFCGHAGIKTRTRHPA